MNIVTIIDMLSANLATWSFLIILVKFITKRMPFKKVDRFFMKIHKPAGYVLAATGLIHMIFSIRVIAVTSIWVYVFGVAGLAMIVLAIVSFACRKKLNHWLFWHRLTTLAALAFIGLHLVLA